MTRGDAAARGTSDAVAARPAHGYVAGVCAGFAARLGIDPLLIRLAFVLALAAGGVGSRCTSSAGR